MQVHELLEAAEENVGGSLHEGRPRETLEVLNSVVRVLEAVSVQKPLVNRSFTFQPISQCLSALVVV